VVYKPDQSNGMLLKNRIGNSIDINSVKSNGILLECEKIILSKKYYENAKDFANKFKNEGGY